MWPAAPSYNKDEVTLLFIHLGNDVMIRTNEIVAILEGEPFLQNKRNRRFLDGYEKAGHMTDIGEQDTKSVIITDNHAYLSPFSPVTLKHRIEGDLPG